MRLLSPLMLASVLLDCVMLASLMGCSHTRVEAPEEAEKAAHALFESRCSTCHGLDGKGRGPLSAGLNPRPRDYTDASWQRATSDGEIRSAIVKGGIAVGKSALMPPNPDLEDRPQVVDDLVLIVRSFGAHSVPSGPGEAGPP